MTQTISQIENVHNAFRFLNEKSSESKRLILEFVIPEISSYYIAKIIIK